jgi:hypothetical protein
MYSEGSSSDVGAMVRLGWDGTTLLRNFVIL